MKINRLLLFVLIFIPIYGVIGTFWGIVSQNYYTMFSGIACLAITFVFILIYSIVIVIKSKKDKDIAKSQYSSLYKRKEQEKKELEKSISDSSITVQDPPILSQQMAQKRQNLVKEVNLFYFNEHSPALVEKYAQSVNNYIEKLLEKRICPFAGMFKNSETPISSILIYPYRNSNSPLLKDKIKRDGLEFTDSSNEELNNKIWKLTDFFITGLKKRIENSNEWQDEVTLPLLLYTIVRNNVIKYYHDKYLEEYGFESIEDFCQNVPNTISKMYYVYFYIYETDINLPFVDTYNKICIDIKNEITRQKEKKLEDDLFGSSKKQVVVFEREIVTLSPIERVDNMSGEEFEFFMTRYFENQGFKTTHTPISGDYGIDLIIENDFGKIGVQAKCYSNKVSLDAVQQVVAGLRHYGLSSGIVITNNYFQPSAIRLAADNNITLWDRNKLKEKLGE